MTGDFTHKGRAKGFDAREIGCSRSLALGSAHEMQMHVWLRWEVGAAEK
jgi:hypothetical protein